MQRDKERFPLGKTIKLEALSRDPYPIYANLRVAEPVTWIPSLKMYFVTRYEHVKSLLMDTGNCVVGTEHSTIFDTFGEHMLTVEGTRHVRYKSAHRGFFMPKSIRTTMESRILSHVNALIDGFEREGAVELRSAFASRLPVLTMLSLFGLPAELESSLRQWYDSFEKALANFDWDKDTRVEARGNVIEFLELINRHIDRYRAEPDDHSLLSALVHAPPNKRLSDEEIRRNALIVFFGGISTVEAIMLNAVSALFEHPDIARKVEEDSTRIPALVEETLRWMSPVQSATRHVVRPFSFGGVDFQAGETVNCMLGSANRDPDWFENPDEFILDRPNIQQHMAFAVGTHHCLGSNLARAETRIAIERLLVRLPNLRADLDHPASHQGHEFRQPKSLHVLWG